MLAREKAGHKEELTDGVVEGKLAIQPSFLFLF